MRSLDRGVSVRREGDDYVVRLLHGRCEDCDLRNALDARGFSRPHPSDVLPLRRSSPPVERQLRRHRRRRLTEGCEGCGGTGRQATLRARVSVATLAGILTAKQRFVLEHRVWEGRKRPFTQREVAEAMGVSQPMVSKIEAEALDRVAEFVILRRTSYKNRVISRNKGEGIHGPGRETLPTGASDPELNPNSPDFAIGHSEFLPGFTVGTEGESSVSISPFVPHREGLPPNAGMAILAELCESDEESASEPGFRWPPDGFIIS